MPTSQDKLFFAIRKTEDGDWIDINTWGYLQQTSESKAREADNQIPGWAKYNKVVRYSQFKLIEI